MTYFDEFDISFPPSFIQITSGVGIPLPPQENLTLSVSFRVSFEGELIILGRAKNNDDGFYRTKFSVSSGQNYHKKTLFWGLIGHKPEQLTTREIHVPETDGWYYCIEIWHILAFYIY